MAILTTKSRTAQKGTKKYFRSEYSQIKGLGNSLGEGEKEVENDF